jgi:hypothetical protein
MFYLKSVPVLFTLSILSLTSYSQAGNDDKEADDDKDSTTQVVAINPITARKRGVYKTYEEYLGNSPSVAATFSVKPLRLTKNNPLVAEAAVDYTGRRPKKIWGVSDGENVYIRVSVGQFFKNHYFKLQCDGPQPYIFYVENPVFLPLGAGLVVAATVAATSAALPPFVSLMVVRDETNYFKPTLMATSARVKRYLAEFPDLLEAYNKEPKSNKATRARYITAYNQRKMKG